MRPVLLLLALLALMFILGLSSRGQKSGGGSIEYQDQRIGLSKQYGDYDDYKNDPENIAPGEIDKVQRLVQFTPIGPHFSSRSQMVSAVFDVKFPGYELSSSGERPQPDGSVLELYQIEIPRAGKYRYFLFRGRGGAYTLIDDFVYSDSEYLHNVAENGGKLIYSTMDGTQILERSSQTK